MDEPLKQFFGDVGKFELDGFKKSLRQIERFGQYREQNPTGVRLAPWVIAITGGGITGLAGAMGDATTAGVAATGLVAGQYILRQLFTTKTGKNLLLSMHNAKGQKKQTEIARKLMDYVNTTVVPGFVNSAPPLEREETIDPTFEVKE
jgi:hypothetical protein